MSNEDIIRAWRDEDYWESLDPEQKAQLPENPAGIIELSDEQSQSVGGGGGTYYSGYNHHISLKMGICQGCGSTYNCGGGGAGGGGGGGTPYKGRFFTLRRGNETRRTR